MKIYLKGCIKIDQLIIGEFSEFEKLYKLYYDDLCRFAYHYIMNEESEDIVQETFVKLYENRAKLTNETNLKSYLFSAVKNGCLNYLRHLNVVDSNQKMLIDTIVQTGDYGYDESEEDEELRLRVESCMAKLSEQQRNILKLKAEGNDYKHIASLLNISPGTVNTHIIRAYKFFRDNFVVFFIFFK